MSVLTRASSSRAAKAGSLASSTTACEAGNFKRAARALALARSRPAISKRIERSAASDSEIRAPKNPYPPNTMTVCIRRVVYRSLLRAWRLRKTENLMSIGLDHQADRRAVRQRQYGAMLNRFGGHLQRPLGRLR